MSRRKLGVGLGLREVGYVSDQRHASQNQEVSKHALRGRVPRVHPGKNGGFAVEEVLALTIDFCRDLIYKVTYFFFLFSFP